MESKFDSKAIDAAVKKLQQLMTPRSLAEQGQIVGLVEPMSVEDEQELQAILTETGGKSKTSKPEVPEDFFDTIRDLLEREGLDKTENPRNYRGDNDQIYLEFDYNPKGILAVALDMFPQVNEDLLPHKLFIAVREGYVIAEIGSNGAEVIWGEKPGIFS